MSDLHRAREQFNDAVPPTSGLGQTAHQALGRCWCGSTHSVDEAVEMNEPPMTLREAIEEFVPDGFRDEDGVWHLSPHQREALGELDRLERDISLCAADTTAADLAQDVELLKAALAQIIDLAKDEPGGLNYASRASRIARDALGWERE